MNSITLLQKLRNIVEKESQEALEKRVSDGEWKKLQGKMDLLLQAVEILELE